MQLPPSPFVSDIVKHYLLIKIENGKQLNYRLFSDGNPGIVFHFKDSFLSVGENSFKTVQSKSFLYGQLTQFKDLVPAGEMCMLVVVLQPHAIYTLCRISAHELNNEIISLHDLFYADALNLEEKVLGSNDVYSAINSIEHFLARKRFAADFSDKMVNSAVNLIYQDKGKLSVKKLLNLIPITERQLERKFNIHIGISPKKFMDIIKFQSLLKFLQHNQENISHISYKSGYYDQAHLNNVFRKFVGTTPSQYTTNQNHLAINFMQV